MPTFRLRWAKRMILSRGVAHRLRAELRHPAMFYLAIALKLIPGLYRRPIRLILLDGKQVRVRSFMTLYVLAEIFLDRVYDIPGELGPVKTIIDVGSNTGLFVVRAKQRWPDATIIACEPEPDNFNELKRTIAVNGLKGVSIRNTALSRDCGKAILFRHPRNVGGHSLYHEHAGGSVEVSTETIQNIIAGLPEGTVCDLLKIDCEGCEAAIFESLDPASARRIRIIIYEVDGRPTEVHRLNERLCSLGFRVEKYGTLFLGRMAGPSQ